MRKHILHIALFLALALGNSYAQTCAKATEAIKSFQAKDLELAKKSIDAASIDPTCANEPSTWYYKAFIYKDYYRSKESSVKNASSRNLAIEAARKNIELDPKNKFAEDCKKIISFLSVSYYNDAAKDLNDQKYQASFDNYVRYLETVKLVNATKVDTSAIFYAGYSAYMANNYPKAKEYFNLAQTLKYKDANLYYYLGKVYWASGEKDKSYAVLDAGLKLFPQSKEIIMTLVNNKIEDGKLVSLEVTLEKATQVDPKNLDLKLTHALVCEKLSDTEKGQEEKYFKKSEALYKEVLKNDLNNARANYNLAILYYNKAVNIIDKLDPDSDLPTIDKVQDQCVVIFKQSLPFMLKAYQLNPNKKDVLEGLAGIYFALNDLSKSNEFKQKADAMK